MGWKAFTEESKAVGGTISMNRDLSALVRRCFEHDCKPTIFQRLERE